MTSLPDLLVECQSAQAFERDRIIGFHELLGIPNEFLSGAAKTEVIEALSWSEHRLALLVTLESALSDLINDGYPGRDRQQALLTVVKEFRDRLRNMELAVKEFESYPQVKIVAGKDLPE
jgi:hypothetical protein